MMKISLDPQAKALSIATNIQFDEFEHFAQPLVDAMDCCVIDSIT